MNRIYYDRQGETLSAFIDFNTIKVWPLLHTNRIKIRNSRIKSADQFVVGTMMLKHNLYTIQCNNMLKEFNIMTGKLTKTRVLEGLDGFRCKC